MKDHEEPYARPTFWLNRASRLLTSEFERALRGLDFGIAYLPVAKAIETQGPLTQASLKEIVGVEQPTMANLLVRMERDGLIERSVNPSNRKETLVSLSAKGVDLLPEARSRVADIINRALSGLDEHEQGALGRLASHICENLRK